MQISTQTLAFAAVDQDFLAGFFGSGLAWSPSTPLSGQMEKAGHFWHPATTAIGQSVMVFLLRLPGIGGLSIGAYTCQPAAGLGELRLIRPNEV
jgi:hypothetical protein